MVALKMMEYMLKLQPLFARATLSQDYVCVYVSALMRHFGWASSTRCLGIFFESGYPLKACLVAWINSEIPLPIKILLYGSPVYIFGHCPPHIENASHHPHAHSSPNHPLF
jgi:hypothetical protein